MSLGVPALIDALAAPREIDLLGFSIAAHGFLFQNRTEVAADVNAFLPRR